ncbi:hypothetical protein [Chamaesiphon sp.]|uniref:hypothetical protein n=1 Tax=Chamaesiphon sp. TaxID=2814140 RepID=UPI00359451A8
MSQRFSKDQSPQRPPPPNTEHPLRRFLRKPFQIVRDRNYRQGYVRGLQQLGWLSLSALPLFIVGAIWEAFSLRYLIQPLTQWLL